MGKPAQYFQSGDRIIDPKTATTYTVQRLIGRGAFAQVFLVKTDSLFAIKVIDHYSVTKQGLLEKIESEVLLHRTLKHPHIVNLHSDFRDSNFVYLVLEYCENGGLDTLLKKRKPTLMEIREWVKQTAIAVKYMHEVHSAVHRDLKLGNMFLDGSYNIKVGDFGLAAVITNGKKRTLCGTPNYIAPEVLFDKKVGHSFEVDVWALGIILYTLLVGTPPFQKTNVKDIYQHINEANFSFPKDYEGSRYSRDLIERILTRDPQSRPSIDEILEHKFFLRERNTVESMAYCLEHGHFELGDPKIDYATLVLPVSEARGIGYCLASQQCGMYFIDGLNLAINQKGTFVCLRKHFAERKNVVRKEEHENGLPPELESMGQHLLRFVRAYVRDPDLKIQIYEKHYSFLKKAQIDLQIGTVTSQNPHGGVHLLKSQVCSPTEAFQPTYVLKMKKVHGAIVLCFHNGAIQIEFPDQKSVIFYNMGKSVSILNNDQLTTELRSKCLHILNTIK